MKNDLFEAPSSFLFSGPFTKAQSSRKSLHFREVCCVYVYTVSRMSGLKGRARAAGSQSSAERQSGHHLLAGKKKKTERQQVLHNGTRTVRGNKMPLFFVALLLIFI